ncbi:MAG: long-chain-fatty-acid--CoA ligase [Planctomycetes bacterium]|nr:long-chain-fatty-acid--CoA ligase [Planctomycetota bacterium]
MNEGLWRVLADARVASADHPAVVDGDRRCSYAELGRRVDALARGLDERGLRRGDRVACLLPNGTEILELTFAAAGLAAVLVPLNTRLAPRELGGILDDCDPRLLVVHETLLGVADAAARASRVAPEFVLVDGAGWQVDFLDPGEFEARPVELDELAHLYYTSGTTGRPKGVQLSGRNVLRHAQAAVHELGLGPEDRWGHFAPMFHLADAWATIAVTLVGGLHVMLPSFEAGAAFEVIEREGVTLTNLVPTMLNFMVHDPRASTQRLASMRRVLSGGAPIAPELVRRVMELFGCEYVQTYGLTETSPYLTLSLLHPHLESLPAEEQFVYRAKTGRAFAAVELRVIGADGVEVPRDGKAIGEIQARGETVTRGYWNRPEETAAAFDGEWFRTGDLATIDAEGYLEIVDRAKDVILTGGETVYSTEVEFALAEHPSVLEAAVFATPDERWGELVSAAVVPVHGATIDTDALGVHCRERLAAYKCPRIWRVLDALPKTGSGKIRKAALRE